MNLNQLNPGTAKAPESAPQAATPVPEGQTETVATPAEARAELHTDHSSPDTAAAEVPAEEVAVEAMPADENLNPNDTFNVSQPADEPSLQNLHDPNARPVVGEDRPGTTGSAESTGDSAQNPQAPDEEESMVSYTCAPLEKFGIGSKWQFERGILNLPAAEAAKLDALLPTMDARTRALVKKIDVKAAEAFLANRAPQASKRIDSVDPLTGSRTEVGTEDVLGLNRPA